MHSRVLDVRSPLPLYHQLQEHLLNLIEEGTLAPGDPLPTESVLSSEYQVSRATVREALRRLADRGVIEKRQGIGSFVAAHKIHELLPGLTSFSNEMHSRGFSVRSAVLEADRIDAPARVAKALNLPRNSQVVRITRLRYVDDEPFLISVSHLLPEVSLDDDFSNSLYELLATRYGCRIATGQATIEAGLADEREQDLLNLPPRDAVLRITWLAVTDTGKPIEYSETTYNGNRYRYIVQLHCS